MDTPAKAKFVNIFHVVPFRTAKGCYAEVTAPRIEI